MEEIFKEYGGTIISIIGGTVVFVIIGIIFMGDHSNIADLLKAWGIGGI